MLPVEFTPIWSLGANPGRDRQGHQAGRFTPDPVGWPVFGIKIGSRCEEIGEYPVHRMGRRLHFGQAALAGQKSAGRGVLGTSI